MKQKRLIELNAFQLWKLYSEKLPHLCKIAEESEDLQRFKEKLKEEMEFFKNKSFQAAAQLNLLLEFDSIVVSELSTSQKIKLETIKMLYSFLKQDITYQIKSIDGLLDLYFLFREIEEPFVPSPFSKNTLKEKMNRWPSGEKEEIQEIRKQNKERIIQLLIKKIESQKTTNSKYKFEDDLTDEEKYNCVKKWWNDYKFHLSFAVRTPSELNSFLGHTFSDETLALLKKAQKKGMPFFCTPYYLSLLSINKEAYDDYALRSYVLYSPELVETYGEIKAWEKEDEVVEGEPNVAGWLLPEGHNIHRRYPEVAILIPDTMGRSCGGLCASCQRMYDFQSKRLNFKMQNLKPKESWNTKLTKLMHFFEEDTQIRDILITGGDALMSQNRTLKNILEAVLRMAKRKRKANLDRKDGEKYAEIQRIRLGSRLPAYLPMRIDDELISILREFKEKAKEVGIQQFFIQTHFQTPLEITKEAAKAIEKLLSSGWIITNQLVYNVAASRQGHTTQLRKCLNEIGVLTYYTFTVKGFRENYAVYAPISRTIQEQKEEKIFGKLEDSQLQALQELWQKEEVNGESLQSFLKKYQLPFLSTDRSVLNLPGIGKSMTFKLIGLTEDGKRVLQFKYDHTRKHSPVLSEIGEKGKVFIVENKSIASFLRQLNSIGENVESYKTIWHYREGETESLFPLYVYPEYSFKQTMEMNHLDLHKKQ